MVAKKLQYVQRVRLNEMMHVVIHELAHVARNDIEHDDAFWNVQAKLQAARHPMEDFIHPLSGTTKMSGKWIADK